MSLRSVAKQVLGVVFVWAVVAAPQAAERATEAGIQFGIFMPDKDLSLEPRTFDALEPTLGVRGGYFFRDHYGWFADAKGALFEDATGRDVNELAVRTGFEILHAPHTEFYQTFVDVGAGWLRVDQDQLETFDRAFLSVSVGQRFAMSRRSHYRWELRIDDTVSDSGLNGKGLTTGSLIFAVTWGGRYEPSDADGDGVPDRRDHCPDTPLGARVDAKGCPLDGDGDGVYDGLDRCPDTPRGWPVDSDGCPRDSDGDGVVDGADACPDTPRGVRVDSRGCPTDSDGDGVFDGLDACPDTPAGARVDSRGCPLDSDRDGVYDGIDKCPDTPAGAVVDALGCPLDSDGDGVLDGIDECPDTPPGTPVTPRGCPRAAHLFEEERETLVLEGVYFELNSATLTPASRDVLDRVARSLLDWPEVRVEIGGHTDSTGAAEYNLELSGLRAASVREYLVGRGVSSEQLAVRGYGETGPLADNRTAEGRARNRRVELRRLN